MEKKEKEYDQWLVLYIVEASSQTFKLYFGSESAVPFRANRILERKEGERGKKNLLDSVTDTYRKALIDWLNYSIATRKQVFYKFIFLTHENKK